MSMLSSAGIAKIRADIVALEKAHDACSDSGLRTLIEDWIKEQKAKLESERLAS
jgi:hypothetical protein